MSLTTFIDGVILSQRFRKDSVPQLAGLRTVAFRQNGDIRFDGSVVEIEEPFEPLPERLKAAWIQGSHNTKVQTSSDGTLVQLKGNPGRFNRSDNVFNRDWEGTIHASNQIMAERGLPAFSFGEPAASPRIMHNFDGELQSKPDFAWYAVDLNDGGPLYEGARVWTIHVTRNYLTGSPADAALVINYLGTQSVSRVKKKLHGSSTVTWGSLGYCQVEAYNKADEMMAHCKGDIEREQMRQNPVYQWALNNGLVRVEVKAAKDYLREAGLTWAGDWTMAKVVNLFESRTEILQRVKADVEEFDPANLPTRVAMTAAAWLRGEDVKRCMNLRTFQRHAAELRKYGIDIAESRNVHSMPVRIKTIEIQAASAPDWYWTRGAA